MEATGGSAAARDAYGLTIDCLHGRVDACTAAVNARGEDRPSLQVAVDAGDGTHCAESTAADAFGVTRDACGEMGDADAAAGDA